MTRKEIELIIKSKKLPKDELDNFGDNIIYLLIVTSLFGISIWSYYKNYQSENIQIKDILYMILAGLLFFFTIWSKKNEKNLKSIQTKENIKTNIEIINKLCENDKWKINKKTSSFFEIYIHTIFKIRTHKLTFICDKNEIFYNLRNTGTYKGRMPYNLGIDTIRENIILNEIKNYAQQRV